MAITRSVEAIGAEGDKGSYYTKFEASMAGIGSVIATRASGGVISFGVEGPITGVIGFRMSSGNGETHGSPYASQRAI